METTISKYAVQFFSQMIISQALESGVNFEALFDELLRNADNAVKEQFEDLKPIKKRKFFERHCAIFRICGDQVFLRHAFYNWGLTSVHRHTNPASFMHVSGSVEGALVDTFKAMLEQGESHFLKLTLYLANSNCDLKHQFSHWNNLDKFWFFKDRPNHFIVGEDCFISLLCSKIPKKSVKMKAVELSELVLHSLKKVYYEKLLELISDVSPEMESYFELLPQRLDFFISHPGLFSVCKDGYVKLAFDITKHGIPLASEDLNRSASTQQNNAPHQSATVSSTIQPICSMSTTKSIVTRYVQSLLEQTPRKPVRNFQNIIAQFNLHHPNVALLFSGGSLNSVRCFFKHCKEFEVTEKVLRLNSIPQERKAKLVLLEKKIIEHSVKLLKQKHHKNFQCSKLIKHLERSNKIRIYFSHLSFQGKCNFFLERAYYFTIHAKRISLAKKLKELMSHHISDKIPVIPRKVIQYLTDILWLGKKLQFTKIVDCMARSTIRRKTFFNSFTVSEIKYLLRAHPDKFDVEKKRDYVTLSLLESCRRSQVTAPSVQVDKISVEKMDSVKTMDSNLQRGNEIIANDAFSIEKLSSTFDNDSQNSEVVSLQDTVKDVSSPAMKIAKAELATLMALKLKLYGFLHYDILVGYLKEVGRPETIHFLLECFSCWPDFLQSLPHVFHLNTKGVVSLVKYDIKSTSAEMNYAEAQAVDVVITYLLICGSLHIEELHVATSVVCIYFKHLDFSKYSEFLQKHKRLLSLDKKNCVKLSPIYEAANALPDDTPVLDASFEDVVEEASRFYLNILKMMRSERCWRTLRRIAVYKINKSKCQQLQKVEYFLKASSDSDIYEFLKTRTKYWTIQNEDYVFLNEDFSSESSSYSSCIKNTPSHTRKKQKRKMDDVMHNETTFPKEKKLQLQSTQVSTAAEPCIDSNQRHSTSAEQTHSVVMERCNNNKLETSCYMSSGQSSVNENIRDTKCMLIDICSREEAIVSDFPQDDAKTEFQTTNFTLMHIYSVRYCVTCLKMLNSVHFKLLNSILNDDCNQQKFFSTFSPCDTLEFIKLHHRYFHVEPNGVISLKDLKIQASSVLAMPDEVAEVHQSIEMKAVDLFIDVLKEKQKTSFLQLEQSISFFPAYVKLYFKSNFCNKKLIMFFTHHSNYFTVIDYHVTLRQTFLRNPGVEMVKESKG